MVFHAVLKIACLVRLIYYKIVIKKSGCIRGMERQFMKAGSWDFGNDFVENIVFFCVDNSSSSHTDNRKDKFLVLGEGLTYGIDGSFGLPEKMFSINFSKARSNFASVYIYHGDNNYLFVNGK